MDCFRFLICSTFHLHMSNNHPDGIFKYMKITSYGSDSRRDESLQVREFFTIWPRESIQSPQSSKFHLFSTDRVPWPAVFCCCCCCCFCCLNIYLFMFWAVSVLSCGARALRFIVVHRLLSVVVRRLSYPVACGI